MQQLFHQLPDKNNPSTIFSYETSLERNTISTAQKIKFSIEYFFSECDQVRRKLHIWSHLLKKSLMQNFVFFCSDLYKIPGHFQDKTAQNSIFLDIQHRKKSQDISRTSKISRPCGDPAMNQNFWFWVTFHISKKLSVSNLSSTCVDETQISTYTERREWQHG